MGRQDDDSRRRVQLQHPRGGVDAVPVGEADVHQHHVGPGRRHHLDGRRHGRGQAHDLDV